jgi:Lrp/AsnC family leucine-responsive transcriptional regulator
MERSPYRHVPKVVLDATDRRILNALQENCRLTNLELADRIGVSPPTCLRRVRRLRKMKLIMREVAILDTDRIRDSLTAVVLVTLKEEVRSMMAAMEAEFRSIPEVVQCYLVAGEVDYVLVVRIENMAAFEHFADTVLYANENIKRFVTLASLRCIKFATGVPIPLE